MGTHGVLLGVLALMLTQAAVASGQTGTYYPPAVGKGGWRTPADPNEIRRKHGIDVARLDVAWKYNRSLSRNASIVVIRHGWLVYEKYQGKATHDSNQDMHSCGKAFTSIAVGILVEEHPELFPKKLDQKIYSRKHLPPEAFPAGDPRRADIKLGQFLSMTSGIRGNNPCIGGGGTKTTIKPPGPDGSFPESCAFGKTVWQRKYETRTLWTEPGGGYSYASANPLILAAMVRKITGKEVSEYMGEKVFGPIGWGRWRWATNPPEPDGTRHTKAQGGIAPRPRDAARFGYLLLKEGRWADKQIVPREYVKRVRKPSPYNPYSPSYGLFFANNAARRCPGTPPDMFAASGAANNHIYIIPSLDMVVVRIGDRERAREDFGKVFARLIDGVVVAVVDAPKRSKKQAAEGT